MFDTLSSLYEALTPVLGLADVDELSGRLGGARLAYDNQRKAVARAREALAARLDPDDEHAALVAAALNARRPDLDAIAQLLEDAPDYSGDTATLRRLAGLDVPADERDPRRVHGAARPPSAAVKDAARTDAQRATRTAALLRQALAIRDPERLTDDCPVCGTADVLDEAWAAAAESQAAELDAQAHALTSAERALAAARRRVESLLDPTARAAPALARGARPGSGRRGRRARATSCSPPRGRCARSQRAPVPSSTGAALPGRSCRCTWRAGSRARARSRPARAR